MQEINQSPWEYFSLNELKCKCNKCGSTGFEMQPEFMEKLIALRKQLNFPFTIVSAYRCPRHNINVSSTGDSGPHTTGRAIDISIHGEKALLLIKTALEHGFTGIGINQKGIGRFTHLDTLAAPDFIRPTVWSY